VIKADGLAAGKGVTVAMSEDEAQAAIAGDLRKARRRSVIEEFLEGEEASFFVITDGTNFVTFGSRRITSASATATLGRIPAGWARTAPRRC
jgi:phosphoribosylamine--glycine ligase